MPELDWQLIAVLAALAVATLFLARRGLKLLRPAPAGSAACTSCSACLGNRKLPGDSTPETPFVSLDSLKSGTPTRSASDG